MYQAHYGHTSQHQAVIVWSDGSATAQYPSEGIAVSVDPDQTGMLPSQEGCSASWHKFAAACETYKFLNHFDTGDTRQRSTPQGCMLISAYALSLLKHMGLLVYSPVATYN